MQNIHSFGVRDLRSFGDKENKIPIKQINIFVGRNSCGKSTLLRTFPLLRQSIQANTKSPILWFGNLVDFGDFETALRDGRESISFEFETTLKIKDDEDIWSGYDFIDSHDLVNDHDFLFPAKIKISISRKDETSLRTKLLFCIHCTEIEISYTGDEVEYMFAKPTSGNKKYPIDIKFISSHGALFPSSFIGLKGTRSRENKFGGYIATHPLSTEPVAFLTDFLKEFHHGAKDRKKIRESIKDLKLSHGKKLLSSLGNVFQKDKYFLRSLSNFEDTIHNNTFTLLLAKRFQDILSAADDLFKSFYSGVKYQGPLRAAGERFYRYQDLRVDEVDHTGSNLPMVINSLDPFRQAELSSWIKENFGFELSLNASGLHYELRIKEESDKNYHNISDMGFGYSQILPVIVSIWLECIADIKKKIFGIPTKRGIRVIVLEQPELHLHPALQYKFGLAIAKVCEKSEKLNLYFVIETHSKHLIDAIGESIRNKTIKEDIVNIALFEKGSDGITKTELSSFDENGYLMNWPVGFLSPDYDN